MTGTHTTPHLNHTSNYVDGRLLSMDAIYLDGRGPVMGFRVSGFAPLGLDGAEEELRAVGVGAGVGHGQDARASVLVDAAQTNERQNFAETAVCLLPLLSRNRGTHKTVKADPSYATASFPPMLGAFKTITTLQGYLNHEKLPPPRTTVG